MNLTAKPSETTDYPVLILDDEVAVLYSLRETLERAGYHVITCNSPLKALEIVRDRQFSVIITDMRMPEMNGLEFLEVCETMQPEATRVLITAVLSLSNVLEAINKGSIYRFIPKPWLHEELLAAVENSVQHFLLARRGREMAEVNQQLLEETKELAEKIARQDQEIARLRSALEQGGSDQNRRHQRALELCWRVLNTYDPALGSRTRKIVSLTQVFARHGGFVDTQARVLTSAAWLCDLGLLGIKPETIEQARHGLSTLSPEEESLLRNHPIYSQTLASLIDEDSTLSETIRAHHEYYDGTGYPDGLTRDNICWTGRCLAVVVGYVESGLERAKAEEFLLQESGRRFDPEAVRLFLKALRELPEPRRASREIHMEELKPGMVLSEGIYTPSGILLVADGQPLTPALIDKIRFHHNAASTGQRLTVYI